MSGINFTKILDPLGLFTKPKETPAPAAPVIPPPPVMPTPDDKAVEAAKRRSIAAQIARRGRQSTMLTDPVTGGSDTLGG